MKNTSRRDFIKTSGAVSSFFILPSGLRANSPNGKICTAHIGTGGKGRVDTAYLAKHKHVEVLGLCDVDYKHGKIDTWSKQFKSATAYPGLPRDAGRTRRQDRRGIHLHT